MNGRSAWLRLWYVWVPGAVLVLLNVVWLAGLRGSVIGRGSILAKQVQDLEVEVGKLEGQARELDRQAAALVDLRENLGALRSQRLAPMRARLVPFLSDMIKRAHDAGLRPERVGYTARREEKTGLVYFAASFGVKGSYDQIRRCVYSLESSPEFVLVDQLTLRGEENASSMDIAIQLAVGTYFADLDERLMRELGVKEVTNAE